MNELDKLKKDAGITEGKLYDDAQKYDALKYLEKLVWAVERSPMDQPTRERILMHAEQVKTTIEKIGT